MSKNQREAEVRRTVFLRWFFLLFPCIFSTACSVLIVRPYQEMSNTAAAIKAAKEVQADTLAPELYRLSNEWFAKAKREYQLKNFNSAHAYAEKSRFFAEEAEFTALKEGAVQSTEQSGSNPITNSNPDAAASSLSQTDAPSNVSAVSTTSRVDGVSSSGTQASPHAGNTGSAGDVENSVPLAGSADAITPNEAPPMPPLERSDLDTPPSGPSGVPSPGGPDAIPSLRVPLPGQTGRRP